MQPTAPCDDSICDSDDQANHPVLRRVDANQPPAKLNRSEQRKSAMVSSGLPKLTKRPVDLLTHDEKICQLVVFLSKALQQWKQPHISKKLVHTVISLYFQRFAKQTLAQKDIETYYLQLVDSQYINLIEVHQKVSYLVISTTGAAPKYYKLVC